MHKWMVLVVISPQSNQNKQTKTALPEEFSPVSRPILKECSELQKHCWCSLLQPQAHVLRYAKQRHGSQQVVTTLLIQGQHHRQLCQQVKHPGLSTLSFHSLTGWLGAFHLSLWPSVSPLERCSPRGWESGSKKIMMWHTAISRREKAFWYYNQHSTGCLTLILPRSQFLPCRVGIITLYCTSQLWDSMCCLNIVELHRSAEA